MKEDPSAGSLKPVNRALTLMEERQLVLCVLIHFDPVSLTHSLADPLIYSQVNLISLVPFSCQRNYVMMMIRFQPPRKLLCALFL